MNGTPAALLAQRFNSILGPAVIEIDQAIVSVQKSQDDLGKEIERLVAGKKQQRVWAWFACSVCVYVCLQMESIYL